MLLLSKRLAVAMAIMAAVVCLSATNVCAAGETTPEIDTGGTAWMLTSTALVLLMTPGLAMFYGGLVRTKNVLGTMMHSFAAMAIIGVLWVFMGYSMSFGKGVLGGWCGWDSNLLCLSGIDSTIREDGIPAIVFAMFQGKFAIITPALIAGAFAERVSFKGYCLFIVLWSILIYNPLCHWVWADDGFLLNLGANGAIDFAGGTVVHISAGISGLLAALYLGPRRGYPKTAMKPNNMTMMLIGCGLLWVGWFGFNAGSAVGCSINTAQALTATQTAAASGAAAWLIIEALRHGKATTLGIASGILSGLVVITPAAGVVTPAGAMIMGAIASCICYGAISVKNRLGYDDSLDVFGIHGIAGLSGALLLVPFIRDSWMADAAIKAGTDWSRLQQFGIQAAGVGATVIYTAIVTIVLLVIVNKTVGLRISEEAEMAGIDHSEHGEHGYGMLHLG